MSSLSLFIDPAQVMWEPEGAAPMKTVQYNILWVIDILPTTITVIKDDGFLCNKHYLG